jgi:hypothetical protein
MLQHDVRPIGVLKSLSLFPFDLTSPSMALAIGGVTLKRLMTNIGFSNMQL